MSAFNNREDRDRFPEHREVHRDVEIIQDLTVVLCREVWRREDLLGGGRLLTLDLDVLLSTWIFGIVRLDGIM